MAPFGPPGDGPPSRGPPFGPASFELHFLLNGEKVSVKNPDPRKSLAEYIRKDAGLNGTKISCNQGGCGACTVVLSGPPGNKKARPINSCLTPLCTLGGLEITTIEGLCADKKGLHPLQKAVVEKNGMQCGFCTPGVVMSLYGLLENESEPTAEAIEGQLDGNLCRCTGFRPILDAGQSFAFEKRCAKARSPDIEELCSAKRPLLPGQALLSSSGGYTWFTAQSLSQLYTVLRTSLLDSRTVQKYAVLGDWACLFYTRFRCGPGARMVAGNTSTGVYPPSEAGLLIDTSRVPELQEIRKEKDGIGFGGAVTIADAMKTLSENERMSSTYGSLHLHMKRVAHHQVRNVGTLAGNLMMAHTHESFASDLATIFMAAGAILTCGSAQTGGKSQRVSITQFFELEAKGLVIEDIFLPVSVEKLVTQKVALRRQNAHALVNMGIRAAIDAQGVFVKAPTIVYGGVAGRALHATKTEAFLAGRQWSDEKVLQGALAILSQEIRADAYTPRQEYRQSLVSSLFYKSYLALADPSKLPPRLRSAAVPYERPVSSGSISYDQDPSEFPVSEPLHKLSAELQVTGGAHYLDDLPLTGDALHGAFVLSAEANATVEGIDATAALSMEGVRGLITVDSMIKDGYGNMVGKYEHLFASKKVDYYGQALGILVADTEKHARAAADMVHVTYSDVRKPILTTQDAIRCNSLFADSYRTLESGDVTDGFKDADVVAEGGVSLGHAFHFHLETQRAQATPGEEGSIHIVSSTQNVSQIQAVAANILNKPQHKVMVSVKRVGGAFGAKINRSTPVAAATALAADKFKRPVRTVLDLSTNMQMVGGRNPYYVKYKVGATKDGRLTAVHMKVYMDQGYAYDLDGADMGGLFCFFDNAYSCPNWRFEGWVARTNLPICTYMRAPGYLEGVYIMENCIERIAHALGLSADAVRLRNLYSKGDVTPFGQQLRYCNARLVYEKLRETSAYDKRRADIEAFNSANRWVKRGISLVPTRYLVGWTGAAFSALVNIYPDGSVRLDTSGVEMGQGLNIKVAQVAAYALGNFARNGVPMGQLRVGTTTTLVANNCSGTESSIGSELCCKAVDKACGKLAQSLKTARQACLNESEEPTWQQLIGKAVELGLDLQVQARVDEEPPSWGPFQYMSYGAVVAEAEVDVLTGDWRVLRADILLDCGKSLNPAIDVGQVQGGYVMGLGNFLCEEMLYDEKGKNVTDTSWEYKIPSSQDIPIEFNVSLLHNSGNPSGFLRSKCSGEPPSAMAGSAALAIRSAIASARADRNETSWFALNSPATVETIALASKTPQGDLSLRG